MSTARWENLPTLVTGASSGLGAEFARQLAQRRCPLMITARRRERLEDMVPALLESGAPRVEVVAADLAKPEAATDLQQAAADRGFPVAGLINNAGLGYYGLEAECPAGRRRAIRDVNIAALQELTMTFLPGIRQAPRGLILNVASIAAFMPLPDIATYAASKAFVTHWSLALERELRESGANILVHTLCPGPTVSEFMKVAANDAQVEAPGRMPVERCIHLCLEAVDDGRILSVPGPRNRLISLLPRLLPARLQTFLARKGTSRPAAKFD